MITLSHNGREFTDDSAIVDVHDSAELLMTRKSLSPPRPAVAVVVDLDAPRPADAPVIAAAAAAVVRRPKLAIIVSPPVSAKPKPLRVHIADGGYTTVLVSGFVCHHFKLNN